MPEWRRRAQRTACTAHTAHTARSRVPGGEGSIGLSTEAAPEPAAVAAPKEGEPFAAVLDEKVLQAVAVEEAAAPPPAAGMRKGDLGEACDWRVHA